jgi:GT2 family glycosyltransferase
MASVSLVIQPFVKVDTLEHQLASLLRCTDKEGVNLVLFSDNPAGTSSEYVRKNENVMRRLAEFRASHHSKFNDVIIHRIEENRGPYKTCELAIDFALGLTDFAIFSEDDTVFARDALVWFRRM